MQKDVKKRRYKNAMVIYYFLIILCCVCVLSLNLLLCPLQLCSVSEQREREIEEPYIHSRENAIISKFLSKFVLEYLIVSSSPLRYTVLKSGLHSVIRAIPTGTNIQQNLYMQNSADTFYTETHQQMHVEQN